MSPSQAVKNGKRYRYYISQALLQNRAHRAGQKTRIPAHEIEAVVVTEIRALLHDTGALLDLLTNAAPDLAELHALLASASDLAQRWPSLAPATVKGFVRAITNRVILCPEHVDIVLSPNRLRTVLRNGPATGDPPSSTNPATPR
jgi:site-specific DNA recombinase